jgi:hypothetical protein
MPRFAILEHNHPFPHWDLFLESGQTLRSWRLLQPLQAGVAVPVEPAADHRLMYLDYEGPVSSGRGKVTRVDAGTFTWEEDAAERLAVHLAGVHYKSRLVLTRKSGGWVATLMPEPPQ